MFLWSLKYDYNVGLTVVMTLQTKPNKLRPINFYINFYSIVCCVSCEVRDLRGRWDPVEFRAIQWCAATCVHSQIWICDGL